MSQTTGCIVERDIYYELFKVRFKVYTEEKETKKSKIEIEASITFSSFTLVLVYVLVIQHFAFHAYLVCNEFILSQEQSPWR